MSDALAEASAVVGSKAALARLLKVRTPSVQDWRAKVPLERAVQIEFSTWGRVSAERLAPYVRWSRISDPEWPHPGGRPCPDFGLDLPEGLKDEMLARSAERAAA